MAADRERKVARAGAAPVQKLIVLSDPHLLPAGRTIIGIEPLQRLRAAIRHIGRHHSDAAAVIVLGDLVHDGHPTSYACLRTTLAELAIPVHLMLGNHDHRPTFIASFPKTVLDDSGHVQARVDVGRHSLLLLDTIAENDAGGTLCARRLGWLDRQLGSARGRPVLLFLHHPPMRTGFPGMDAIGLEQPERLLALLRKHGNVRHIFAGHIHRTIGGSWAGIPFSIFKSPVHQQPMDLATVDSTLSVAEPGAYGIVLLDGCDVVVHTEDYEIAEAAVGDNDPSKEALS